MPGVDDPLAAQRVPAEVGVRRRAMGEAGSVRALVTKHVREELQDADAGHPRAARLPRRHQPGLPDVHCTAEDERAVEDGLLPRRRPLGLETTELPRVVQHRARLAGQIPPTKRRHGLDLRREKLK